VGAGTKQRLRKREWVKERERQKRLTVGGRRKETTGEGDKESEGDWIKERDKKIYCITNRTRKDTMSERDTG